MEEETKEEETNKTKLSGMDEKARTKIVEHWKPIFKKAKDFRKAYQAKWLRFYFLYRAYNEKTNYAYETNLMPPIAFEVIETVKPRLAAAKINVRILPRFKKDAESKSLESWDDKIKYDLDIIQFPDLKIDWINSCLQFGDGILGLIWKGGEDEDDGDAFAWIQDLWLFYPDPEATNLQKDSRYEIIQIFKSKKKLVDEEDARGDKKIYQNLDELEDKEISDDPRQERYEINTKKMGQISKGGQNEGEKTEKKITGKKLDLWQIWDHEKNMLLVIANEEELIRYEENPYMNVNDGRIFNQLRDHALLWELWSIGHIEPIETTIHEIADSRNQAMDDIVFNLDPILKVKKKAHLTADDLVHEPGAIWELEHVDDVIVDRPPEISRQWLEKDALLRKEIQMTLAISEYAQGLPKSTTEAKSKVDLLLTQTNIRFSLILRQFEISTTRLVNNLIGLNKEFLTEKKEFRLLGKEISFKDFKDEDRETEVDAIVDIEPKVEKTPMQRRVEIMELYKTFILEDKPEPDEANPNLEEIAQWKKKKRIMQKMILEEYDKDKYEDLILGMEEEEKKEEEAIEEPVPVKVVPGPQKKIPIMPHVGEEGGPAAGGGKQGLIRKIMNKIPLIKRL